MPSERKLPDDPLTFIRDCVTGQRVFWTYHIDMRIKDRFIACEAILASVSSYEIIESYPEDKYLPSYLVYFQHESGAYHVLFAADVERRNVRVITAYRPGPDKWHEDMKRRRSK